MAPTGAVGGSAILMGAVAPRRITVQIKGSPAVGGYPRLSDFLKQLDAIKIALKHTERLHTVAGDSSVDFRIVSLSMSSPATVVLEEVPIQTKDKPTKLRNVAVTEQLVATLSEIERGSSIPPELRDLAALEAYRNIGAVVKGVDAITIATNGKAVSLGQTFSRNIAQIIGPDELIEGSITGRLLAINLHNTTRFEIYPPVGPPKVACDFPGADRELKQCVISGIDHNVRVVGKLRYKHWAPFPHAISAHDIEVYPPNDELPTLESLHGLSLREKAPPPNG